MGSVQGTIPNVLVHAHALAQLLDGVQPPQTSLTAEAAVALLLSLLAMSLRLARWRMWRRIAAGCCFLTSKVCQRIAHRFGGDIQVESVPGEGSIFSFTIPAVA